MNIVSVVVHGVTSKHGTFISGEEASVGNLSETLCQKKTLQWGGSQVVVQKAEARGSSEEDYCGSKLTWAI